MSLYKNERNMEENIYPQTWYVYTYAYPDGTVFYVGKGKNGRLFHHESEARSGCSCGKCVIIRRIWMDGGTVQKHIVFETLFESEALAHEKQLINEHPKLVNKKDMPHVGGSVKKKRSNKPVKVLALSQELSQDTICDSEEALFIGLPTGSNVTRQVCMNIIDGNIHVWVIHCNRDLINGVHLDKIVHDNPWMNGTPLLPLREKL